MSLNRKNTISVLAVVAVLSSNHSAAAQECNLQSDGSLPTGCENVNAGLVSSIPVQPNTEPETGPVNNADGFVLSLDGIPVDADPQLEDQIRRTDVALAQADVQVQLNIQTPEPRLDVEVAGAPRGYRAGETVTLISETNYPAFLNRGEMRIIDRQAVGGPRLLAQVPVQPNGRASFVLPEGRDLVVVHRVYDARGRYDETEALPLSRADDRGQLDDVEEGTQFIARRGIRVNGGTVTVSATDVAQGAVLETLGERVRPDRQGRLVIERILPAGEYEVDVNVTGGGQNLGLTRPLEVPGAEWFFVGVADLTYGRFRDGQTGERFDRTTGRLQYYVDGETENGYQITSSLDTGEEELDEIFQRLDEKNPRDIIDRIDPNQGYPTYGDDSTIVDNTPTSGRFFLRIERDNSFLTWGDYQARIAGNGYLRNERTLYGAQIHYETQVTTQRGDPVSQVDFYAAQPDQLIGRDVFEGTGGSVYFLRQQDISLGTETISVEIRDRVTNRVIDRRTLIEGRDYQINHVQGVVTLNSPLTGSLDRGLISTEVSGDELVNLVVQYEFTPTSGDVDGFSYGGRAEAWVTDDLRIGVTGLRDDTGIDDLTTTGADIRYELGDNSFVQLDYAQSDGQGFALNQSRDGGLAFDTEIAADGSGSAVRVAAQADLNDLGFTRSGVVAGYFETREQGFNSLDYSVTAATGDETLYGVFTNVEPGERGVGYSLYADFYENGIGDERLKFGAEVSAQITERLNIDVGFEQLTEETATRDGNRQDAAVRLNYALRPDLTGYVFGQTTLSRDGLEENERYGAGLEGKIGDAWAVGLELSDGRGGFGGRVLATYTDRDNNSTYFGYELDPGRAIDVGIATADNAGRYVVGGRRQITDQIATFGENSYEIFSTRRETIGAYGVTYTPNDFLSYTTSLNFGRLEDEEDGDIDRTALSFGARYEDSALTARARLEFRQDDFEIEDQDVDAVFFVSDVQYKISEEARLLFNADVADINAPGNSFQDGRLVDVSLGYSFRPIDNERLNVLGQYRYFSDTVGQEIDGVSGAGPVQESHIINLEGSYDINPQWTIGAKAGGRFTQSAAAASETSVSNDAWLGVVNARYHFVKNWDALIEVRHLSLIDGGTDQTGFLATAYRHLGDNARLGVGYNFSNFSSDLSDLTFDDEGAFINLVLQY